MGYLSQEQSIFRKLTVEKNLLAILEALPRSRTLGRQLTRSERWERTNALLERFKLEHVRKNTAARCSGGEKRRLEIARCLVCEPLLILLDEPFAAVDPKTTEDIRRNIRELAHQGIGILLTDHNVREVLKITDRSYLIKDGQVVTQGTPQQLINDPIAISEYLGTTFTDNTFGGWRPHSRRYAEPAPTAHGEERTWPADRRGPADRSDPPGGRAGTAQVRPGVRPAAGRGPRTVAKPDLRVQAFEVLEANRARLRSNSTHSRPTTIRARQLVTLRQQLGFGR